MDDARLAVVRDGISLPEDQAKALWRAFSEHMEQNPHDVDGFARSHGFARVRTEHRRGRAVLLVSSRAASLPPPPASRPSRAATADAKKKAAPKKAGQKRAPAPAVTVIKRRG